MANVQLCAATLAESVQDICVILLVLQKHVMATKIRALWNKIEHERIEICNFVGMIGLPAAQISHHL